VTAALSPADRDRLLADVRDRLFTPLTPGPPGRVGAEAELIARDVANDRPLPIRHTHDRPRPGRGDGAPDSLALLQRHGERLGWVLEPSPHGAPRIRLPGGTAISFEPGGQIEVATRPFAHVNDLVMELKAVVPPLVAAAREAGAGLIGAGIDPWTPLTGARLQLEGERYRRMASYLSAIGDAGPRMMLQTAALQVNVELGPDPALRWRALNAAAPYLTAVFANSRTYEGADSGFASYRARQWRLLDRRRTGLLGREVNPAAEYLDFALEAGWIFGPPDREPAPFGAWMARGEVSLEDWRRHLTTLFPEVRPRGFLEIRCIDALPPEWLAVPPVLLTGLLHDTRSVEATCEIVGEPDSALLADAARHGLADPRLAVPATDLFRLALATAARAGIDRSAVDTAQEYFDSYTGLGRAPADDEIEQAA
jgi:glutamate--cysteine ligase